MKAKSTYTKLFKNKHPRSDMTESDTNDLNRQSPNLMHFHISTDHKAMNAPNNIFLHVEKEKKASKGLSAKKAVIKIIDTLLAPCFIRIPSAFDKHKTTKSIWIIEYKTMSFIFSKESSPIIHFQNKV